MIAYKRTSLLFILVIAWSSLTSADEYILGIGDVIKIQVYEQPDLTTTTPISRNGSIRFWLLGDVAIKGLTISRAEGKIAQLLKKGGFIKNPRVIVSVEQYRSQQISVLGWVNKPGTYAVEGLSTVIDVLAQAGGLKTDAGDVINVITTKDGGTRTIRVDVGLIYAGDLGQNIEIQPEDLIVVPKMDVFYVYGEVRSPNAYRLERGMTVMQAVSLAGGITDRGTDRGLRVNRKLENRKIKEIKVELTDTLKPNDVLFVKERLF